MVKVCVRFVCLIINLIILVYYKNRLIIVVKLLGLFNILFMVDLFVQIVILIKRRTNCRAPKGSILMWKWVRTIIVTGTIIWTLGDTRCWIWRNRSVGLTGTGTWRT